MIETLLAWPSLTAVGLALIAAVPIAGRWLRVAQREQPALDQEVDVEAHVQVGVLVHGGQGQLHRMAHAHLVDVAHVEDLQALLVHEALFARVDAADADLPHGLGADGRHLTTDLAELSRAVAAQARHRHAPAQNPAIRPQRPIRQAACAASRACLGLD